MRNGIVLLSLVSLCACASANRTPRTTKASDYKARDGTAVASKGQAAPDGKMICEEEMPLGSHVPRQICHYEEDLNQAHQDAQDFLHSHPTQNTNPGG
jgi:hypothetical protein